MKKVLLLVVAIVFSLNTQAQEDNSYLKFEKDALQGVNKKHIVKSSLTLTQEEESVFWPLYNEYNEKMNALQNDKLELALKYNDNYGELTEGDVMDIMDNVIKIKKQLLDLEKKYYKKMINIMSPVKVVNYFKVEHEVAVKVETEILKGSQGVALAK